MTRPLKDRQNRVLRRMGMAIERAISSKDWRRKDAAARWASAWGQLCGIPPESPTIAMRRDPGPRLVA